MYSYYLDFLKSFKKFIAANFPQIEHYQFNFADNAFLHYKLYQEHVKSYPMCMISLTDIGVDDNRDFFRYISTKHATDTVSVLASNHTKQDSVIMDFKWVTLQVQVKINLYGTADILNYQNQLISAFPKNLMFYAYAYTSLIQIDDYIQGWETTDDTEGITYRATSQKIEGFANYHVEPIIRINSVTPSKEIDQDTYIDVNMEIRLKVPNVIGTTSIDNRIVNGIQILVNTAQDAKDLPILVDMNNDIFSDRKGKLKRSYLLDRSDFIIDTDTNDLEIEVVLYQDILNRPVAIFMVNDSTLTSPVIEFIEIPIVTPDMIIQKDIDGVLVDYYRFKLDPISNLNTFNFTQLSNLQLFTFE